MWQLQALLNRQKPRKLDRKPNHCRSRPKECFSWYSIEGHTKSQLQGFCKGDCKARSMKIVCLPLKRRETLRLIELYLPGSLIVGLLLQYR